MLKNSKVTKTAVNNAADLIASRGQVPTIVAVRAELQGKGSETTIHNYLKAWKTARLLKQQEVTTKDRELGQLIEDKRNLEQALTKQIVKNEHYAQELINAEKANIKLAEENHQVQTTNQELQLKTQQLEAVNTSLQAWYQKLQAELDLNRDHTIKQQQQIIDSLQTELKQVNETSLIALRETSSSSHELLMQEKINSMNLQEKINSLNKQLAELQKQLQTTTSLLDTKQQPLLRQLEWQQQIIQNHIGFDKLKQIEEQELMKKFTIKVADHAT